jgi:membrane-bound lytic murein transglycosylase D
MKQIFFILLFVVASSSSFSQSEDSTEVNVISPDDPVLVAIDSMMASGYFESLGFNDNPEILNVNGYAADSVPIFDSITYANRFEVLNSNSPFCLVYNNYITGYINLYAKRRKKTTAKMLGLAPLYFPIFEENLDKYNLPLELKYLPIVESALNPKARSRVGASGLWQFMYRTGKMFDLQVTSYYDERSDVYKSTDAACRYLKSLHKMYDDWNMALAAYNCGPGNVNKAIRRSGGKKTYWEIRNYLPRETRGYVPAFLAVNYVMAYASEHNIYPKSPDFSCFNVDTVTLTDQVSFAQLSEYLDLSIEHITFLNPTYKHNFIPNSGEANTLCLPVENIGHFLANEKTIYALKTAQDIKDSIAFAQKKPMAPRNKGNAVVYKVKSGDVLGTIAGRYHCRVSQLKEWNNLYSDRLKIGQRLYIYSNNKPKNTYQKATTSAKSKLKSDGKYMYHTVRQGDNLWDIANKYEGVSVEQLQELNKAINTRNLKLGTKLRVKQIG